MKRFVLAPIHTESVCDHLSASDTSSCTSSCDACLGIILGRASSRLGRRKSSSYPTRAKGYGNELTVPALFTRGSAKHCVPPEHCVTWNFSLYKVDRLPTNSLMSYDGPRSYKPSPYGAAKLSTGTREMALRTWDRQWWCCQSSRSYS